MTVEGADAEAGRLFDRETWAAMKRIAEARPHQAVRWGAIPRGHAATLDILRELNRSLPALRKAHSLAVKARAPHYEWGAAGGESSWLSPFITGDLDQLCSFVFQVVPEVERTVKEIRSRVNMARERDSFEAERFRANKTARQWRESRALFITAVIERYPDITHSESAWGCAAIALRYEHKANKVTWPGLKSSWGAEVRRLAKVHAPEARRRAEARAARARAREARADSPR